MERKPAVNKTHTLDQRYFSAPTWCSLCHDFIWGQKGYACKECNCPFDKKCLNQSKLRKDCGEWLSDSVGVMLPGSQKSGWMMKKGAKLQNLKRRFFILRDEYLYYFRSEDHDTPSSGSIHLLMASTKRCKGEFQMSGAGSNIKREKEKDKEKDKELMFEIITSGRTYYIKANNEGDLTDWISHLRGSTQMAMNRLSVHSSPVMDKLRQRLFDVVQVPGNGLCADCNDANPEWASINIGVFICVNCSGIHRNLGVHISQVRSIILDDWEESFVETMEKNGNARSNAVLEQILPPGVLKPLANAQLATKELYIRAKYEERAFTAASCACCQLVRVDEMLVKCDKCGTRCCGKCRFRRICHRCLGKDCHHNSSPPRGRSPSRTSSPSYSSQPSSSLPLPPTLPTRQQTPEKKKSPIPLRKQLPPVPAALPNPTTSKGPMLLAPSDKPALPRRPSPGGGSAIQPPRPARAPSPSSYEDPAGGPSGLPRRRGGRPRGGTELPSMQPALIKQLHQSADETETPNAAEDAKNRLRGATTAVPKPAPPPMVKKKEGRTSSLEFLVTPGGTWQPKKETEVSNGVNEKGAFRVTGEKAVMLYDFVASSGTEMSVSKGATIFVLDNKPNWSFCVMETNQVGGYVPTSYFQIS